MEKICRENSVLVVSDEIHCDLVFGASRHIPFASPEVRGGVPGTDGRCSSAGKTVPGG